MKATHQLIDIMPTDAYYDMRDSLIGKKGWFVNISSWKDKSKAGIFKFYFKIENDGSRIFTFHSVIVKEL